MSIKKFLRNEDGATAIEYALIAGMLSIVVIGTLTTTGPTLKSVYQALQVELARITS